MYVDPTAAAVVEPQVEIIPHAFEEDEHHEHWVVRALRRWPLHTSYDKVIADVGEVMRSRDLRDALIVLDVTGPGRFAGDVFMAAHRAGKLGSRWPWAYTIGGAQVPTRNEHIAKKDPVTNALLALNRRRVHIPAEIPYADVLKQELAGYSHRVTRRASASSRTVRATRRTTT
jgi:hypothetical protein